MLCVDIFDRELMRMTRASLSIIVYKSPAYEIMTFKEIINRLLQIGYPKELEEFEYDPSFPVRYENNIVINPTY